MLLNKLTAISPVDGRYRNQTEKLADYFSEYALIRYRIRVEVEYFIALCELPLPELSGVEKSKFEALRALYLDFSEADALRVKEIEATTNHDVKAIEYILKEKMEALGLSAYKEFVHFGLTSQDINNTSIPLTIKDALAEVYFPAAAEVLDRLREMAREWHDVPLPDKSMRTIYGLRHHCLHPVPGIARTGPSMPHTIPHPARHTQRSRVETADCRPVPTSHATTCIRSARP